jgi:hypothetical protein
MGCCRKSCRLASSAPSARQRACARWFKMEHFEQNWLGFAGLPPDEYSSFG